MGWGAVCLRSKGRGAIGMESGGQRQNRELGGGGRESWLMVQVRILEGGCSRFHGALRRDGSRSELRLLQQGQLVDSVSPLPVLRTVDTVPSCGCSFHFGTTETLGNCPYVVLEICLLLTFHTLVPALPSGPTLRNCNPSFVF